MRLALRLDYGHGEEVVLCDLLSVVKWERMTGLSFTAFGDQVKLEDLCFLAHNTLVNRGADVPASLDDFIGMLVEIEADPEATQAPKSSRRAATASSSPRLQAAPVSTPPDSLSTSTI